ncbi:MAG: ABC transporter ATP-binding protein [Betaproteobacteria bacterium]
MADLKLRGVEKAYGSTRILQGIDLDIQDGEFVVFVGPSGCGKSTLLRCIAGLEDITGGELCIGGQRMNEAAPSERGIAMVFQSYALYPHLNLYDNMAFGLQLARLPKAEIDAAVRHAARILHIEHLLERKPKDLSGGQRQRVAIGRAIVRQPAVFLFDEPLSNLDTALRVQMRYEFAKLHEQLKTTMVYVTHDQVEAMTLADRIVVLSAGRVEQVGAPLELYEHPCNQFVAGFIGSPQMNFLPAVVVNGSAQHLAVRLADGSELHCDIDGSSTSAGQELTLGIRPEHLGMAAPDATHNLIPAEVTFVEALGGSTVAYCAVPGQAAPATVQLHGLVRVQGGQGLRLQVSPALTYAFDASGAALKRVPQPAAAQAA